MKIILTIIIGAYLMLVTAFAIYVFYLALADKITRKRMGKENFKKISR